jgi:hypothetical protein
MASALVAVQRATNKGVVVHVVHRVRILMVPIKQAGLRVSLRRPQDHVDLPILSCTIVATKSHKIKGYTKKEEKMGKR